jgi:hypothetical protein
MTRRVAVLQSNYIPWKGYFDIIHDVDVFVFYDDVQYTKNDWRNRNRIKTPAGPQWLTIPVGPSADRLVCEVEIPQNGWAMSHWKTIRQNYSKAPYFDRYAPLLEETLTARRWATLSQLNQYLIRSIAEEFLGIHVEFRDSREYKLAARKLDRLCDLLRQSGADTYISGPSAKDYIDEAHFDALGIDLCWKDYSGYPEYAQLYPPFDHAVSIIDLLFHVGPEAPGYIWGWREERDGTVRAS